MYLIAERLRNKKIFFIFKVFDAYRNPLECCQNYRAVGNSCVGKKIITFNNFVHYSISLFSPKCQMAFFCLYSVCIPLFKNVGSGHTVLIAVKPVLWVSMDDFVRKPVLVINVTKPGVV